MAINHKQFDILAYMDIDVALKATQSWFLDHGWRILLIVIVTILIQRFGAQFFGKIIASGVESSDRFETARDRTLRANTLTSLFGSIIRVFSWLIAGVMVLSELGVIAYLAPLFGSAVAISLILGFGIQTFVKDFISGLFIVADNQYRVGDYVALTTAVGGTVEGAVIRITLRTTVLRDDDGAIHFIPNGHITRAANQTLDYAKVNVELTLPITADFDAAEKAISALGLAMSKEPSWHHALIQAPFYHGMQHVEAEKVVVEVRAKTVPAEQWRVSSELQKRLAILLTKHDNFDEPKKSKKKSK